MKSIPKLPAFQASTIAKSARVQRILRTPDEVKDIKRRWLKRSRKVYTQRAKQVLLGTTAYHPMILKPIEFTSKGIKEAINQPHKYLYEKNKAILEVPDRVSAGKYCGRARDNKGRNRIYHYIETIINNEKSFVVIKEEEGRYVFYSIVDRKGRPPTV